MVGTLLGRCVSPQSVSGQATGRRYPRSEAHRGAMLGDGGRG
jgi:hypothetical protein